MAGTVLISTIAQDYHAMLVDAALRHLGIDTCLVSQSSMPGSGALSVGGDWRDPTIGINGDRVRVSEVGAFWNRRSARSFNYPETAHAADLAHIDDSFRRTLTGLATLLDDRFPVNSIAAAQITASKLNQLGTAAELGLSVPRTLVSNDPKEVRAFTDAGGPVCVKPLSVYTWIGDGKVTQTLTALLNDGAELDPRSVALMPVIYQAFVPKAYEVRLTLFGGVAIGTRIDVAEAGHGAVDWRTDRSYLKRLTPVVAPDHILKTCRVLLKRLGLRFGSFDFIVTSDGDWVFMEVNQAGQFIWQEQFHRETRVIEPFARFLANADEDFEWDPRSADPQLAFAAVAEIVTRDDRYHALRLEPSPQNKDQQIDEADVGNHMTARARENA